MVSSKFVFIFLLIIFFLHILALANFWYWTIWWFDIMMHFLGGFWAAALFFYLNLRLSFLSTDNLIINNLIFKNLIIIILALSFVSFVAVCWEFYEFLYDVFISAGGYYMLAQQGLADTIVDLFFGLLGGLIASVIILLRHKI